MEEKINQYFNPLARIGNTRYSILLPLFITFLVCVSSEVLAYQVFKDPMAVGTYIIFVNVALVVYFAFRDGIRGGVIPSILAVVYYFYIIYTRQYSGNNLAAGIQTTLMLGAIYLVVAGIIGWLKQTLDVLFVREVEARLLAEEGKARLQTVLAQLPVGVSIADVRGRTLTGNDKIEEIFGRKADMNVDLELSNRTRYAYKNGKKISVNDWPILRALKSGAVVNSDEIEYIKGKNRKFLRMNAAPIRDKRKKIIAAVSTYYDVTSEKELEIKKNDFVNMASHELKTPITSMKLYVELASRRIKKFEDPGTEKTLGSIKVQIDRLQELVSALLDVSRIQTGKLYIRKEKLRLDDLVSEVVEIMSQTANEHIIKLKKKAPVVVYADRFRIHQVLTNLINNAAKYSPKGSEVSVSIKKEKGRAIVSVEDHGIGIEKSQRKKIFDRLYQVSDPREKTYPGLGMGLYISREIVRKHKGKLWVDGEKGKGSTFFFTIPAE